MLDKQVIATLESKQIQNSFTTTDYAHASAKYIAKSLTILAYLAFPQLTTASHRKHFLFEVERSIETTITNDIVAVILK